MSEPESRRIPTEDELKQLPRWARVAFAARCVRRVQPLFKAGWPDAPEKHVKALDTAIIFSERAALAASVDLSVAGDVAADAVAVSRSRPNASGITAVARSAGLAAEATDGSVRPAARAAAGSVATAFAFTYVYAPIGDYVNAAAYTTRADIYASRAAAAAAVATAIRRDYDLLLAASKDLGWTDDTPVPPEFFGPMWPEGAPEGWPEPEHDEDATPPVLKFEIALPAGMSAAESRAIDAKIVELLAAMSAADVAMGGNGLRILDESSNEPFPVEDETPLPVGEIEEFLATGGRQ